MRGPSVWLHGAWVAFVLALALALSGCVAPAHEPPAAPDVSVSTLADAAPLVEAGTLTAYATWLADDGVRHSELADPADPARAAWRVLAVCVTDEGEQMLFVPPGQLAELAEADIAGCAPGL